jgi:thiamine biosynthesis lipoprotein
MVLVDEAMSVRRHTFRAMGTTVGVVTSSLAEPTAFVEAIRGVGSAFQAYEDRFSRFLQASELSKVNARSGSWTKVSEEFSSMLSAALDGARRTDGLFDPTVLPALVAAGYDRDLDDVLAGARDVLRTVEPCGRWADIERDGNMIRLPRDVALDFGGIAKGWTVDVAVELASELLPWVLVEAGGDLRVGGEVPAGGVDIAVEDPHDPRAEVLRLRLLTGALATSSVTRRAWGLNLHHLIDPRTERPAMTGVVQATSWAPTCREAELRSTWALLAGRPVLDRIPATLVLDDGTVVTSMTSEHREGRAAGGCCLHPIGASWVA